MKYSFIILSVLLIFNSCNLEKKGLTGVWAVEEFKYLNKDVVMKGNMFFLNSNKTCKLPNLWEDELDFIIHSYEGNWLSNRDKSGKLKLNIETKNIIFNGEHDVRFLKDKKRKLLIMELKSENLYVRCHKLLLNYDSQQSFIDELVESSN